MAPFQSKTGLDISLQCISKQRKIQGAARLLNIHIFFLSQTLSKSEFKLIKISDQPEGQ